ncbi:MAG: Sulfate-transp domain-containing protein [Candidatus Midichloria mitochondrii]|uniref:Uncharacterized protein n=1 Tax=Midichloria mitochondrii (strain IricVA) TaxID=696127 RepID=F7XUS4_MIDMI|nr:hypothetical protein [Candidatus Midichloria mitochondrii]AEI88423.1 hypothetical protein midi_00101 [Candidatus Midichloria mitochondrii IricVA]MDJ1256706.1 hypothetical protein [Candidatus Midichloria mitochondrii]MDJ1288598.1 hypothetical protein [Candidatus Midichloria mitochondrii]MDJ1299429.1 hypothetical protein [Candidatus Midichloria mitochondrii]MDJ1313381.1 hypothetical protein [Candidatus Midichloria mitochondrii]
MRSERKTTDRKAFYLDKYIDQREITIYCNDAPGVPVLADILGLTTAALVAAVCFPSAIAHFVGTTIGAARIGDIITEQPWKLIEQPLKIFAVIACSRAIRDFSVDFLKSSSTPIGLNTHLTVGLKDAQSSKENSAEDNYNEHRKCEHAIEAQVKPLNTNNSFVYHDGGVASNEEAHTEERPIANEHPIPDTE